ncbi:hypothetical protein HZS_4731 [Henneguya salminicola]|nr:hypothetical protein HZS_4731 [Henneguya salminicola]
MLIANIKRIPVSTTHSIVGSILGYGIVLLEGTGIIWITVAEITASWIISPLASGCVSVLIFVVLKKFLINQVLERIKTQKLLIYILGIYFITIFLISLSF